MAKQLIASMADKWTPADFRDEFKHRLSAVIEKRLKAKGMVTNVDGRDEADEEAATTNVVDFMSLLQKSLASTKRTPAKSAAKPAARAAGKAVPARKVAKKAAPSAKPGAKTAKRRSA